MNIIDFLPLSIYEFECDPELVDRILADITNLSTIKNASNLRSDTDLFHDAELYDWFDSCIEEAKEKLYIPKDIKLDITSCWFNKTKRLKIHHMHSHPNSFMSGIFYLSGDHAGGATKFITENIWWKDFQWIKFTDSPNVRSIGQQYTPKKGKLLLFPSSLMHNVTALLDNSTRYTISFNTFFSGPIANGDNLIRLKLKSESVVEKNNEA